MRWGVGRDIEFDDELDDELDVDTRVSEDDDDEELWWKWGMGNERRIFMAVVESR